MFWLAFLGVGLSSMLIKLGSLSATVGILSFVIKLLIFAIFLGLAAGAWFWIKKKAENAEGEN